jgi:hypothetical protein
MNIHWRFNHGSNNFDRVDGNPIQYYQQLMDHVKTPTLIIDINLVNSNNLETYLNFVLDAASKNNSLINFKQLIFDASLDPVYDYNEKVEILNNFVKNKGIPGFLSLSQFEINHHSHLKEIMHPSWFFIFKKQKLPKLNLDQKQWKYSCLNRNPIWHRLLFYTMVKEKNLLDQFVYTFYDKCPYNDTTVTPLYYFKTKEFFGEYFSKCMNSIPDLPLTWPGDIQGENDHTLNHSAYLHSECNIVTESSSTVSFISEKIWKPIAAGQAFHVVGSVHTNKWLQSLGFYTFDNNGYDSITDDIQRIKKVIELLDRETMWDGKNLFSIEHNYHLFYSGAVEKAILDPLVAILDQ